MNFDRAKLQESVDFALARIEDQEKRRKAAYEAYCKEAVDSWREQHLDKWRHFRDELTKALKKPNAVIVDRGFSSTPPRFRMNAEMSHFTYNGELFDKSQNNYHLKTLGELRQVLSYTDDPKISSTDLRALGYHLTTIKGLLEILEYHKTRAQVEAKARAAEKKAAEKKETESK